MSMQKDCSNIQEREVADKLGGAVTSASGASKFSGGDVETLNLLVECKTVTTPRTSFSIKQEWLDKVREQAFEQGKDLSALVFRFSPTGSDYVILDIDTFKELLDSYSKEVSDNV